jgi:hypothetical protein
MRNRRERRKAAATYRKNLARLNTATLDQHFDEVLRRVRAEFERTGGIDPEFECVTDGESFHVPRIGRIVARRLRYTRCCEIAFVVGG